MADQFDGVERVVMLERGFDARIRVLPVLRLTKSQVVTGDGGGLGQRRWWRRDGYEVGSSGSAREVTAGARIEPLTERNEDLARRDTAVRTVLSAANQIDNLRRKEKPFAKVATVDLECAARTAASLLDLLQGRTHV